MTQSLYKQTLALRKLLANKRRWTQSYLAVNKYGRVVNPCDEGACELCMTGGIAKVEKLECDANPGSSSIYEAVDRSELGLLIAEVVKGIDNMNVQIVPETTRVTDTIVGYNDFRTHEEVMEVLNTAVAFARGAGV